MNETMTGASRVSRSARSKLNRENGTRRWCHLQGAIRPNSFVFRGIFHRLRIFPVKLAWACLNVPRVNCEYAKFLIAAYQQTGY